MSLPLDQNLPRIPAVARASPWRKRGMEAADADEAGAAAKQPRRVSKKLQEKWEAMMAQHEQEEDRRRESVRNKEHEEVAGLFRRSHARPGKGRLSEGWGRGASKSAPQPH